jgi:hypothetical protein
MCIKINKIGKQEVGIWWVQKRHFSSHFLSNYLWQKSDIWSRASYMYPISWEASLDPSDFYFLLADFVDLYSHWTYMLIFRHIFLRKYWRQDCYIWSQTSYRYAILWEALLDPSDSCLKTLPTIWHTYMKFVTKYQIPVVNSCLEECYEKCAYTNVC